MADRPGPDVRTIPVQRIRPGDHAFAAYRDEAAKWALLGAFVHHGLARGEKVLALLDPSVTADELLHRLGPESGSLRRAWRSGQLELSSMRALLHPHRRFTTARQWQRLAEESRLAAPQGHPAARAYIDMAWVADLGTEAADVVACEHGARHLFAGRAHSEVCAYDVNAFPPEVLNAAHELHPVHLLGDIGALLATHTATDTGAPAVRLVGEADIATAEEFAAALHTAFARREQHPAPPVHVDLTGLHFLGAGCAALLLRLASTAGAVDVVCTTIQDRVLRRLGAAGIPSLTLRTAHGEERRC